MYLKYVKSVYKNTTIEMYLVEKSSTFLQSNS